MGKFILKSLCFSIPFALYLLIVVLIDPYNYLDLSQIIPNDLKTQISYRLNYPLWHIIEFKSKPSSNILIGDSRISRLKPELIAQKTGDYYYNFSYGGGTIEESISTFWVVNKITKLEKVIFGINFNNFNASHIRNRVPGVLLTIDNPILYFTNWNVLQASYLITKKRFFGIPIKIEKPKSSKAEFWEYKLNFTARRFYSAYKYPYSTYEKLKEVARYCKINGIQIVFVTLPTHVSLQEKVRESGLEKEMEQFLLDLRKLGEVYDFDCPTAITKDVNNFSDPFHIKNNDKLSLKLVEDIFVSKTPTVCNVYERN